MNRKSQRQSNARDTGDSPIIPEKIRRESSAQPNANSNIVHVNTGALEVDRDAKFCSFSPIC